MDVRAAFVPQREAAETMQPGQGAFDNPAEDTPPLLVMTLRTDKGVASTARTYAILTAPAAGWFSNVR